MDNPSYLVAVLPTPERSAKMRQHVLFICLAFLGSLWAVYYFNEQPAYTDAYYHYNAAVKLASGEGWVDSYLWVYIGAPDQLPAPSHLYWMPFTSFVAGVSMSFFGVTYQGALVAFVLMLWGAVLVGYWLGLRFGQTRRHAWIVGLMVLFGGFYLRFWGAIDTFTPYALFGAGALVAMGIATERRQVRWWIMAGGFSAIGHLIRNDGLLFVFVGVWVIVLQRWAWRTTLLALGAFLGAYLLGMSAWFIRLYLVTGSVLPVGGTQSIWFKTYDDLFNYPADSSMATFFENGLAEGLGYFLQIRLEALWANLQNFIGVEGFIILMPFMVWALWQRRREPFWGAVVWFALGIHGAFTFIFPLVGTRGGLFHAGTALLPFWAILGILGIESAIEAAAKRRRHWKPATAKPFFTVSALLVVVGLGLMIGLARRETVRFPPLFGEYQRVIPQGARVMINDVAQLYYYTGIGGVVLPNESIFVVPEIAQKYEIDYLILEFPNVPYPIRFEEVPPFLERVPFSVEGIEIYRILREGQAQVPILPFNQDKGFSS